MRTLKTIERFVVESKVWNGWRHVHEHSTLELAREDLKWNRSEYPEDGPYRIKWEKIETKIWDK
jgi:hypothetical protein